MKRCRAAMMLVTLVMMMAATVQDDCFAQNRPRARDLGVPFEGVPGPLNAITDVKGVEVGHTTLISGDGKLVVGQGPVRTGVTAIFPRGKDSTDQVFAGWFSLNGNGEMTGTTWVEESGFLEGPVMLTNTHSVGVVRDAVIAWRVKKGRPARSEYWWSLPVVAETWDGFLNDINGFHVRAEHVGSALAAATDGPVQEGNVGGGTGMICHGFKGGIGSASRVVDEVEGGWTVGALVQANHGRRAWLRIDGVRVGEAIGPAEVPIPEPADADWAPPPGSGSIIVVVATDAPLLPHQCERLARRASLGIARAGGTGGTTSGDLIVAFATGDRFDGPAHEPIDRLAWDVRMVGERALDGLFGAAIEATEEAIVNALVAADTMTGRDGHIAHRLPHDRLREVMAGHGRLAPAAS